MIDDHHHQMPSVLPLGKQMNYSSYMGTAKRSPPGGYDSHKGKCKNGGDLCCLISCINSHYKCSGKLFFRFLPDEKSK